MVAKVIGRLIFERRRAQRRHSDGREVIASHGVFDREERQVWQLLERRCQLRREHDQRRRIPQI
jgi:hypothetical protein